MLFSGSFRPWHGVHVLRGGGAPAARRAPICSSSSWAGGRAATAHGFRGRHLGTRALRGDARDRRRRATSASRPTTRRASRQLAPRLLLVAAQDLRVHGVGPAHGHDPAAAADRDRARRPGRRCSSREGDPDGPGASRSSRLADDPRAAARGWAPARARAWSSATPGPRHCEQLERVLLRIAGVKIVLATRGLPAARRRRGLVDARPGPRPARGRPRRHACSPRAPGPTDLDGLRVRRLRVRGRKRLAVPRAFARALAADDGATWSTRSTRSPRSGALGGDARRRAWP